MRLYACKPLRASISDATCRSNRKRKRLCPEGCPGLGAPVYLDRASVIPLAEIENIIPGRGYISKNRPPKSEAPLEPPEGWLTTRQAAMRLRLSPKGMQKRALRAGWQSFSMRLLVKGHTRLCTLYRIEDLDAWAAERAR